jgi:phosphotriesterase-related protein
MAIETTAGPIEPDELGRTLIHEHLLSVSETVRTAFPHLHDEDAEYDRAVAAVKGVQSHRVKTIVDPSVMDLGRDIGFMSRVAQDTGIQLVPATGLYGMHYTFLPHHFQTRDEDYLADAFVHDVEQGIQGTEVKAAFLKCAADEPGITPDVEKLHRAIARASNRTGRPIMAHSRPASETGLDQMRIFTEEGVDPNKVQIAHTGDTDDLDYIEKLLQTGCWIGMDRFGIDLFLATEPRNKTVAALCERGYAERMFLSADACSTLDWYPQEMIAQLAPKWTMTYIFEEILPALGELGVTDEQITTMLDENPVRWLTA